MVSHNVHVIYVVDVQIRHGADQCLDGCKDVLKHQASETFPLSFSVSSTMDDPHLFDESALPTLTSPWANETDHERRGMNEKLNEISARNRTSVTRALTQAHTHSHKHTYCETRVDHNHRSYKIYGPLS